LIDARNISQTEYSARLANEAAEQSRVRQLDLQIQAQELRIERHRLRAPFSGIISARHADEGEWLDSGSAAFELVQTHPLRVIARVPERYFGEILPGTPVTISVDARPGESISATVDAVVAATDVNSRSFTVRMDIPNTKANLAPGMSAHLTFSLGEDAEQSVLQVVADAIVRRSDGSAAVWVVRDGLAQAITVVLGRRNGQRVEVISEELRENDQAVTLGNESLRPGQAVTAEAAVGRG
jgi:RND family efflux transporter MFP subunit